MQHIPYEHSSPLVVRHGQLGRSRVRPLRALRAAFSGRDPADARPRQDEPTAAGRHPLFIGSSIFRFWTHLSEQMAPLPVFNHASGGSVTQDILDRADQLVFPYKPRIIVYYCGSNDVGGGEPAGAIIGRTKQFLKIAGERLPDTFVYYTAIQKAPDKRDRWDVVETVNRDGALQSPG